MCLKRGKGLNYSLYVLQYISFWEIRDNENKRHENSINIRSYSRKCSNFCLAWVCEVQTLKFNTFLFYFISGTFVCVYVWATLTCFKYFNIIYLFKCTHTHRHSEGTTYCVSRIEWILFCLTFRRKFCLSKGWIGVEWRVIPKIK